MSLFVAGPTVLVPAQGYPLLLIIHRRSRMKVQVPAKQRYVPAVGSPRFGDGKPTAAAAWHKADTKTNHALH
jgi:hypothetical protein